MLACFRYAYAGCCWSLVSGSELVLSWITLISFTCSGACLLLAAYADELRTREKQKGIEPDTDIDALLKAAAQHGKRQNIVTDLILRILGLEVGWRCFSSGGKCCRNSVQCAAL